MNTSAPSITQVEIFIKTKQTGSLITEDDYPIENFTNEMQIVYERTRYPVQSAERGNSGTSFITSPMFVEEKGIIERTAQVRLHSEMHRMELVCAVQVAGFSEFSSETSLFFRDPYSGTNI